MTVARDRTKPQTAEVQIEVRDYRAADFDRLWQIDQLCFPPGIAYTQMELSGFITARNAITLVAELPGAPRSAHQYMDSGKADSATALQGSSPAALADVVSEIAGFIVAHPYRKHFGRILTLDVAPVARRLGAASRLIENCEQRLRAGGCQQIFLETAVNNAAAIRLYRRHGYEIVKTLPDYYASHSLDAFVMKKEV